MTQPVPAIGVFTDDQVAELEPVALGSAIVAVVSLADRGLIDLRDGVLSHTQLRNMSDAQLGASILALTAACRRTQESP